MVDEINQMYHIQRNGIDVVRHMLRQADHRLKGMEDDLWKLSEGPDSFSVEYIILHHSLTTDGDTVSWNAIRRYHTLELQWDDIGYHYGIEFIDDRYEILAGRMLTDAGAHCRQQGMNRRSLGICFVGNFDLIRPLPVQWDMGLKLVRSLMTVFGVPREHVCGHREFAEEKSCPGVLFDIEQFRGEL
jgi:N-acetylmuramoyl-L-alanine amidase